MTDELVQRHVEQLRLTGGDLADLCQPLADAIEALTSEVQRWQCLFDEKHNLMLEHKARAEAAEAERDRLKKALEDLIADCEADYPPSHGAIKYAAKLALKGETP